MRRTSYGVKRNQHYLRLQNFIIFTIIALFCSLTLGCGAITVETETIKDVPLNKASKKLEPSAWTWQNPLPIGNTIRDISFVDDRTGWAVGSHMTILKTTDGKTWQLQNVGSEDVSFWKVLAIDSQTAWVFGTHWSTFVTRNGGTTWEPIRTPWGMNTELYDAYAFDKMNILVLQKQKGGGPRISRTTDGGATWNCQDIEDCFSAYNMSVVNSETIWLATRWSILATENGGNSWKKHDIEFPDFLSNRSRILVSAVNSKQAWVGFSGYLADDLADDRGQHTHRVVSLLSTFNGGSTWQLHSLPDYLRDILIIDSVGKNSIWVAGNGGVVRTINGGRSWAQCYGSPDSCETIADLEAIDEKTAYLSSVSSGICKTEDGGRTWNPQFNAVTRSILNSISAADDSTLWAVGNSGTIIKTQDGGSNWHSQMSGTDIELSGVSAVNHKIAFTVGLGYNTREAVRILKTIDGGKTWAHQYLNEHVNLSDVSAVDSETAWAVGNDGIILKTEDGGNTWTTQKEASSSHRSLSAVDAVDRNVAWAVGHNHVLKTTDGGDTWSTVHEWTGHSVRGFTSVSALDARTAWATANMGLVRTEDGGRSWIECTHNVLYESDWVTVINDSNVIAAGSGGLSETRDGGASWISIGSGSSYGSENVAGAVTENHIWLVGGSGMILRTNH